MNDLLVPPHSIEAEQGVLGGILLRPDAFDDVADLLTEDDFYRRDHCIIWRAMAEVMDRKSPCDYITLVEHLDRNNLLDDAGGHGYIGTLHSQTGSAANIKRYAQVVSDYARERRTIQALNSGLAVMWDRGEMEEKLQAVVEQVHSAAEAKQRGAGPVKAADILPAWIDALEERHNNGDRLPGLSTGFLDFDRMTAGLHKGELIIIAGRPSMGKSTFAQNICEHIALQDTPVLFFSMEMPKRIVIDRAMASVGRVSGNNIRTGKMQDSDWPRITSAMGRLQHAPMFIDDTNALTPTEMRSRARRMRRRENIGLIVADYLQLMRVPGYKNDRVHEIEEISRSLKSMAMELDVPVIAISQLNRSVDSRTDKRPQMSDLRESGAIEQDADLIAFVYRDDAYKSQDDEKDNTAEIIIRKQRNGAQGTVRLVSNLHQFRFDNWDGREVPEYSTATNWTGGME